MPKLLRSEKYLTPACTAIIQFLLTGKGEIAIKNYDIHLLVILRYRSNFGTVDVIGNQNWLVIDKASGNLIRIVHCLKDNFFRENASRKA